MPNPKFTREKLISVLEGAFGGIFVGVVLLGAINYLIASHIPLYCGAILGAVVGFAYGLADDPSKRP